jgi:hypothetical protein
MEAITIQGDHKSYIFYCLYMTYKYLGRPQPIHLIAKDLGLESKKIPATVVRLYAPMTPNRLDYAEFLPEAYLDAYLDRLFTEQNVKAFIKEQCIKYLHAFEEHTREYKPHNVSSAIIRYVMSKYSQSPAIKAVLADSEFTKIMDVGKSTLQNLDRVFRRCTISTAI